MKILFSSILVILCLTKVNGQLKYYNLIEKSDDTLVDFHYIKTIDKTIREKLDSFLLFIRAKKQQNIIEGYIEIDLFKTSSGKSIVDICVRNAYSSYRVAVSKRNNFDGIFAFSFYKSRLILFKSSYSRYRIKEAFSQVIHDLIYAEVSNSVKHEIDKNTDEFQIQSTYLSKRYYLK